VGHPAEFALIFGNPVPGMAAFEDGCVDPDHPGARLGAVFLRPILELWRRAPFHPPAEPPGRRLEDTLEPLRRSHGPVPTEVAHAFLSGWTRLYGLVSMEVFNHLGWAVTDPEAFFEVELTGFLRQLGQSTS
ncbi:MAG TPA: TetR-like C-terminal domain-containing protein, partial [Micromonospora sp.]